MNTLNAYRPYTVLAGLIAALLLVACGQQESPPSPAPMAEAPSAAPERVPTTTASEEALAFFNTGMALANNLRLVEARRHFRQALEKDPEFALAYVMLANTAQSAEDFWNASAEAQALVDKVSPGEQLIIKAQAAAGRNDQAAQLDYLNQLVAMHPKDERTHFQLANYYAGVQDNTAAIMHYGHATTIKPDYATAYNALGYALRANEQLAEAEAAFKTYRDLIPDEPNPYDSYAELLMELGRYDESIENYQAALERDETFVSAHAGISVNQSLKGDVAAAVAAAAAMRSAARDNGEQRAANFREATAHLFAGDTTGALAAMQKNLTLSEEEGNHAALFNHYQYMGDIMLAADDAAKALEYYQAALEHGRQADVSDAVKAQSERTYVYRTALAAIVADDVETATARVADYTAQVEAAPSTALEQFQVHTAAGLLALLQEDYAAAAAELSQSDQTNPAVLYWLALAHDGAGNKQLAAELAAKAANRNPLSPNMPLVRDQVLQLLKRLEA